MRKCKVIWILLLQCVDAFVFSDVPVIWRETTRRRCRASVGGAALPLTTHATNNYTPSSLLSESQRRRRRMVVGKGLMRNTSHGRGCGSSKLLAAPSSDQDGEHLRLDPSQIVVLDCTKGNDVVKELGLGRQYERWTLLQNFLDGDAQAKHVNQVLYRIVQSFVTNYSSLATRRGSGESISEVQQSCTPLNEGAPKLDKDDIQTMKRLLIFRGERTVARIPCIVDPGCRAGDASILSDLDTLLPTMDENEDACNSLWDTVIELHGREMVKINEEDSNPDWDARCLVARVLIYLDFLAEGIVEGPFA